MSKIELLLSFVLIYLQCSNVTACFEEQPLDPWLQEYLAINKTCQDTLFPTPPCCGTSFQQMKARIVGGESTALSELPWVVYINMSFQIKDKIHEEMCGGSLINSLWVLSAAHCFRTKHGLRRTKTVHIGEWNVHTNPDCIDGNCAPLVNKVPAEKILLHSERDLALIRLKRTVKYNAFVSPICLPFTPFKKQCYEHKKAVVAGWGRTIAELPRHSSIKMKATLNVLTDDRCSVFTKSRNHICANNYNRSSACLGDSGGPLNLKLSNGIYYQLGIVSSGAGTCESFILPNVFARIDMKWISKSIHNYENGK